MRVLLSTYGTRGDVQPLVALAARLRALGARVRMCAPPDEEFAARQAALGVEQVPVGPPMRAVMRESAVPAPEELARLRDEMLDLQFAVFPGAAEGCDLLVAAGLAQIAARSVAEAAGIPYVYTSYSAVQLPSPHHAPPPRPGWPEPEAGDHTARWAADARNVNAQFGAGLDRHRAALGLPPVDNVRDHVCTDRPLLAADPALGPWQPAPGLDVTQTGAWILPDERPLPPELVAFLDAGSPPVYVGFGSMHPSHDTARAAVEVLRAQGRRVLVSRGWADLDLLDRSADCLAIGDVSHQALFPRVAAVVHHGGAGTTATAARAGTLQVVVPPRMSDMPYWASRVAALGIGAAHDGPSPTPEALSLALGTALAPETAARAAALAPRIRTDGAEVAARRLVELYG
ncbi:glycosyltransferase [Streptomyces fuscigenes]|uniref:glycosyltransferase n=1 Tax=Streptomyces fuscigenes TaxID=1528880 RepID=UPI001F3DDAA6|nr:glycosyltransferase [Streptomyces fuscigenes]MCF3962535.1 glycosyltransferase [Streptomyces fuscigenes]